MLNPRTNQCYYCGKPATSDEHVPPKCLFPEQKDIPWKDYRKNLITVRSCDKHNTQKSRDDEFLMACLAPIVGNNSTGFLHTKTKLARAYARKPTLVNETLRDARNVSLMLPDGVKFPTLIGKPDMPRLCRVLEAVARGLYFHSNNKRFEGKVIILLSFLNFPRAGAISILQLLAKRMINQERHAWETQGNNPEIFSFQLGPVDQYGLIPMVMTFYSRAEAFVAFQPEGVCLPHKNLSGFTQESPIDIGITFKKR